MNEGMIPAALAQGQVPPPLGDAPLEARVTKVRHCGDSFPITTEDGAKAAHWKKNVRIKIDSAESGPRRASRSRLGPACAAIGSR